MGRRESLQPAPPLVPQQGAILAAWCSCLARRCLCTAPLTSLFILNFFFPPKLYQTPFSNGYVKTTALTQRNLLNILEIEPNIHKEENHLNHCKLTQILEDCQGPSTLQGLHS